MKVRVIMEQREKYEALLDLQELAASLDIDARDLTVEQVLLRIENELNQRDDPDWVVDEHHEYAATERYFEVKPR